MFCFGVDYCPEQWPEERWPEDARLMAEAGVNDETCDVVLPQQMTNLLTDRMVVGQATLVPKAAMILSEA